MTGYTDTMAALAASTDERVQALYGRYTSGEITADEFVAMAIGILAQGESRAVSLADLALAGALTAATGRVRTPVGLLPDHGAEQRAAQAIREAFDDFEPPAKLTINIRDAVLETAQRSYGTAMRRQGVERWTRKLNTGACELCHDLAGDTLPASADMYRHKGCGCSQKPIIESEKP
ncbi:hypothetical protein AAFP35_10085 [Gordonia sp. CPCC 206044]|uniref:hypothetical protein n=1 Tax=Gordonia sp. CPCC 206044 TaxID=3140793 RepID=UPI003AF3BDD0